MKTFIVISLFFSISSFLFVATIFYDTVKQNSSKGGCTFSGLNYYGKQAIKELIADIKRCESIHFRKEEPTFHLLDVNEGWGGGAGNPSEE